MNKTMIKKVTEICRLSGHIGDLKNCTVCQKRRDMAKKSQ